MDEQKEARRTLIRVFRRGVRLWLKHWPRRRRSLESVLISLLADVAECRETDLIEAVNDARPASYWPKKT